MPLPGSGQIVLNSIHVEAGGTSLSACTINDTDIRGLIGKSSGVQMTFSEWYGASANSITWDTTAAQIHAIGSIGTESIAQVQFQNTGFSIGSMTDSGTNNIQTTFLATTGTAEAAPYEIRWQYVTGNQSRWDPVNMSENVFYALSSTRVFNFTVISTSLVTGTFDITIRLIGDVGSEVTKRIVFSGEVESL